MADNTDTAQAPAAQPAQDDDAFNTAFTAQAGREEEAPEAKEEPKDDTPPAPAADAQEPEEAKAPFDPWNGLSDEQKGYFQSLQHSESSNRGRVAALNRQISELRAAGQPPAADQQGKDADDKGQQPKDDRTERLKAAAEEYPDAVGPLVEAIVDLQARLEDQKPQAPAAQEEPDAQAMEKEYQALEKAHPDYRQIGADPSYSQWVASKPRAIQELANSYAADDVANVLTLYKAERTASMAPPKEEAKTDTNAQKRERQLEGSRAVASRGAPVSSGPAADDFNASFAATATRKR
ncbi:hypothetical protein [Sphingobium yanoikuyae]|uniref:hypothetical protein n=1 Tax=Sphingobium yanoikuyae TaxID=13690 RepID=UPI0035C76B1F